MRRLVWIVVLAVTPVSPFLALAATHLKSRVDDASAAAPLDPPLLARMGLGETAALRQQTEPEQKEVRPAPRHYDMRGALLEIVQVKSPMSAVEAERLVDDVEALIAERQAEATKGRLVHELESLDQRFPGTRAAREAKEIAERERARERAEYENQFIEERRRFAPRLGPRDRSPVEAPRPGDVRESRTAPGDPLIESDPAA